MISPRNLPVKQRGHSSGFTLPLAIFLLVITAGVGAAMTQLYTASSQSVPFEHTSSQALYAARAGLEWGMASGCSSTLKGDGVPLEAGPDGDPELFSLRNTLKVTVTCTDLTELEDLTPDEPLYRIEATAKTTSMVPEENKVKRTLRATQMVAEAGSSAGSPADPIACPITSNPCSSFSGFDSNCNCDGGRVIEVKDGTPYAEGGDLGGEDINGNLCATGGQDIEVNGVGDVEGNVCAKGGKNINISGTGNIEGGVFAKGSGTIKIDGFESVEGDVNSVGSSGKVYIGKEGESVGVEGGVHAGSNIKIHGYADGGVNRGVCSGGSSGAGNITIKGAGGGDINACTWNGNTITIKGGGGGDISACTGGGGDMTIHGGGGADIGACTNDDGTITIKGGSGYTEISECDCLGGATPETAPEMIFMREVF